MDNKSIAVAKSYEKLYSQLPIKINEEQQSVKDFLKDHVQKTEIREIDDELKKTAVLHKQKGGKIRKPQPGKCKYLTARERRDLGLNRLPLTLKYEELKGLRQLWLGYMGELLDLKNRRKNDDQLQMKICRADYHGAVFKVTRSLCQNNIGLQGIVVMETRNTFQIITKKNDVKIIPKKGSSFSFKVDGYLFTIDGNIMACKPSERAVKKWKNKPIYDL